MRRRRRLRKSRQLIGRRWIRSQTGRRPTSQRSRTTGSRRISEGTMGTRKRRTRRNRRIKNRSRHSTKASRSSRNR